MEEITDGRTSEVGGLSLSQNMLNSFYNLLPCEYNNPAPLGNFPYNRNGGNIYYLVHVAHPFHETLG
jgi:hypothetical protein